jgi:hypothetical protein
MLPDLERPPGRIEGEGGGPAVLPGPALDDETKAKFRELSIEFERAAIVCALAALEAASLGLEPLALALADLAAEYEVDSKICDTIANDPPKPFQEIVHFERRTSAPPGLGSVDPVVAAVAIASQCTFFAGVTAAGALAAAERLAGAVAAGDYDWAVTHQGVLRQAIARMPVDLGLVAAAQRAAGLAVRGTPADVRLSPGQKGAGEWIADPANEAALSESLRQVGYSPGQVTEGVAWMRSDPVYRGQPSTVGDELVQGAERLYQTAERLATQVS